MTKKDSARFAGLAYLIVVLTGIFSLLYIPSQLIVLGDASETVNRILANKFLFRLDIASGVICYTSFLILPFILYRLLKSVNKTYAQLMVILAVTSVPISIFNLINKVDVLTLLSDARYLAVFESDQINTRVMLLLKSYSNGIFVVQIFWGLWLFPFGYLIFKSGYIPRFLGALLMVGCFGYLFQFVAGLLFPSFNVPSFISIPGSIGEIGICLWLLIMGVNDSAADRENHSTSANSL